MRKITFGTSPLFYGEDNITTAFRDGEIGFELEIRDSASVQRNILTLNDALELKRQIANAIDSYWTFMYRYGEQNK